jgi:hypothetical protein
MRLRGYLAKSLARLAGKLRVVKTQPLPVPPWR